MAEQGRPPVAPSRRSGEIQPFHVMEILARARALEAAGRDIVHMEVGEPDFSTAEPIVQAGIAALQAGKTHYTPALGLPTLRQAIADHYRQRFGLSVDPARVVVTPGASGALQLVLAALIDPGQEVLVTDPGYPCNRHIARLVGAEIRALPLRQEDDFRLDPEDVAAAWSPDTRALMLASPANPTGRTVSQTDIAAHLQRVRSRGGLLIVDEIYQGLVYDREPRSALEFDDDGHIAVVNSFSKYFGMTGWRLGWAVVPGALVPAIDRLAQNLFLAAPTPAQHAALSAFAPATIEILEARRQTFKERRDYLYRELTDMGFRIHGIPEGAFYLYADASGFDDDSFALAERLLELGGVAVTPGIDFGSFRAGRFLRFAYTTEMTRLQEGVDRLRRLLLGG